VASPERLNTLGEGDTTPALMRIYIREDREKYTQEYEETKKQRRQKRR
jgi:hypothetical protein